jgi:GTP pyrophosphokinase
VVGCTDDEDFAKPPEGERGSIADWRSRKQAYIEHVEQTADIDLLRVSCADKLHNARTILLDLYEHGAVVWSRFRSGNRENLLWYYQSLATVFSSTANSAADRGLKRLSAELVRTVELIGSAGR